MAAGLTYSVSNDWGSGFTANLTVAAGATALNGWTVEFDAGFTITNIWGAEIVSRAGTHYVLRSLGWNASVPANGTVTLGFQASAGSGGNQAANLTLNGAGTGGGPPVELPAVSVADVSVTEGAAGTKVMEFAVTLSKPAAAPVSVAYATADGTALAGSDYVAQSGSLTFAAGETRKVVQVAVKGDTAAEADETLALRLSGASGATLARATATGTILNDDIPPATPPELRISDATVTEGHSGTRDAVFTISLSHAATGPVTVRYATVGQTATAGSDFTAASATLTFAAGETSKTVAIKVLGDTLAEANEKFMVMLGNATGATIADNRGDGTILDDDAAPLPALSVNDVAVAEGNAGTTNATFTVSLSQAASAPVTVRYATANGTATAGSDYAAASGTLTFAAGETSKTVTVKVTGDTAVEADEGFTLLLSGATGATIADGTGAATIRNDDAAALPALRVADASVAEGNPAVAGDGVAAGWFHTAGNQIVDAAGKPVQIAGINWFGMESGTFSPHGLWARDYREMMDQMAELGFNTIRLPFSSDLLRATAINGIEANPGLQGLTGLQMMDRIVEYAGQIGLRIILDHHRSSAGAGTSENGLWYDAQHPESQWIGDWKMLAARYADNPTVIGADLHNEPHNGSWGGGGANDWAAAAERAGNAVLSVNPNWLIFVEGVSTYQGQNYWWGGNLMGVKDRPIVLDVADRLVYSAHDYPNSVYGQSWFSEPGFPNNLPAKFEQMWGYIYEQNIAPVWLGEFGSKLVDPKDQAWLDKITAYLSGDFDANGTNDLAAGKTGLNWTWWSWNPNSGDTGGILQDDWRTVHAGKLAELAPIQFDFGEGGGTAGDANSLAFTVTLSAPASGSVLVDYRTVAGTAGSADFTGVSGTLAFAAGETSKTILVPVTADLAQEANETLSLLLSNPRGATLADATGIGTILNDDLAIAATARVASTDLL
ncbi:cellulase family glycosylhydrolase [Roseomonas sp. OT10]|uniref:Calx-beta domain-containing protein n=1 Tax=Roseomonas cutis TaxID=2897332 RepID=UPI001E2A777D|nr:Calx-beta domain-containing protein [Roseomonas sp. OT10]UFN49473.1 cellulase family glycosylhydrolase [Roseomonas sp. OT10]